MGRLTVRAHPRASRSVLRVQLDGAVEVWTTAPPTDGKANEAIRRIVAVRLGTVTSAVRIVGPMHGRTKLLEVEGLTTEEIRRRLNSPADSN